MSIVQRPLRRPDLRTRLALEPLEDRCTPALVGLGAAGNFAILDINGGQFTISGSSIVGNVGIGPNTSGTFHQTDVTGQVDVAPTAHARLNHPTGKVTATGGIVIESLNDAQKDANAASAAYADLAPTQTFRNLTASLTITGNGGTNVIAVTGLAYNHKTLTLSGGAGDVFVFNVARDFDFNHSQIVLTGGVTANHVIFNFTHASSAVDILDSANVVGTFLVPRGSLTLDNSASYHGELIAKNLEIHADRHLTAAGFTLPTAATASLAGHVYLDFDFSGTFNTGDSGLSRVTVTLTGVDSNGTAVNRTVDTADDGSYSFMGLAPGTYQLSAQYSSNPHGTNSIGTVNGNADGTLVGSDTIGAIVLAAGNAGVGYDFGFVPGGA